MSKLPNKLDLRAETVEIQRSQNVIALLEDNKFFNSNTRNISNNPPLIREWINGVYSFNKNLTKTLPIADNAVNRLIKSYFSLIPLHKGKKTKRIERRFRRLSLNRILVSKAEIKHTNNKVLITVYLYNNKKKILYKKLKKLYDSFTSKLSGNPAKPLVTNNTYSSYIKKRNTSVRKNKIFSRLHEVNKSKNFSKKRKHKTLRNLNKKMSNVKMLNTHTNDYNMFQKTDSVRSTNIIKKSYSVKFANRIKIRFSRFLQAVKSNNNLTDNRKFSGMKNKYILLAKKYYSITNKHRLYSENKLSASYLNIDNYSSAYKSLNFPGINTINAIDTIKAEKSIIKAKKSLKNTKHINNIMQKLRSYYKLFYINNTQNSNFRENYLYKLLKKPLIASHSFNKAKTTFSEVFFDEKKTLKQGTEKNNFFNGLAFKKKSVFFPSSYKLKTITQKSIKIVQRARQHKNFLFRILKWNDNNFINYENRFYNKYIKKAYRKELLYLYYTKVLLLNSIRFKNWFLLGLKKIISQLYNKKVEFNFVNLKYLHLNSDIFSDAIAVKLKNRRNRLLTVLKKALAIVNIPTINKATFYDLDNNSDTGKHNNHGTAVSVKNILDTVKYKSVFGVRLEAAGRLSKRLTASRSVFKLKYKGSLKNLESTYNNKPSVILRGNINSNLQYTKISSKTRNGSFGLKGWVSGY